MNSLIIQQTTQALGGMAGNLADLIPLSRGMTSSRLVLRKSIPSSLWQHIY